MIKKPCPTCKTQKQLTEFTKVRTTKDGYTYNCKQCRKAYQRDRRERLKITAKSEKIKQVREVCKAIFPQKLATIK